MNQLFYSTRIENGFVYLDEDETRHLVSALRKKTGDQLPVTDGRGNWFETELSEIGKKHSVARIISQKTTASDRSNRLHVAIAPTKQMERFEWFLEKAVEIGVEEITPLLCKRSERDSIRLDRLEKILVSAMKQSLRVHLPRLNPLTPFDKFVRDTGSGDKFIAWCADSPLPHIAAQIVPGNDLAVAIGPEGDFTPEEVRLAAAAGFIGAGLGSARLRTETAGIFVVAAVNLAHAAKPRFE